VKVPPSIGESNSPKEKLKFENFVIDGEIPSEPTRFVGYQIVLKSTPTHHGTSHQAVILVNSSHIKRLSIALLGPYTLEKAHSKPNDTSLNLQEIE
jgi:hypothetical protein